MGSGNGCYLNGLGHRTKMAGMAIYVQNPSKSLFLQNQWADCLETQYVALGSLTHHSLFK